jgi:predicted DCC family thiol-disulfide oxidoreductase YuxK
MLQKIDWRRRLQFVDGTDAASRQAVAPGLTEAAILVEMYVIDQGARYGGYDGYLRLARVIPLLWPFHLVGSLPGIRPLGYAVYRLIAAKRVRRGRCTDDLCAPVAPPRRP